VQGNAIPHPRATPNARDRQTGEPTAHAIVRQDRRTAEACRE
jgi:glycerol kinase